eukprot:TRINITY_DN4232_c0_g1_i1.p1 TRINITY_DN4232_c0_g1~~TRINITY_DN4232_c0_g1_i1.p1  ORF type:complete len:276 (-),score=51.25 TRINITY_DN4232_c0_g1_i1:50-850(-)
MDPYNNNRTNEDNGPFALISQNIERVVQKVHEVTKLLQKFGTAADTVQHRDTLQRSMDDTRQLIADTRNRLNDTNNVRFTPYHDLNTKTLQTKLAKDLQTYSDRFNALCTRVQEAKNLYPFPQKKENIQQQNNQYFPPASTPESEENQRLLYEEIKYIDREREFNRMINKERDDDIRQIQMEMVTVNEISRDLALLVDQQGAELDNIEKHLSESVYNAKEGVSELRKAQQSQKSERSKMWWILLIIVIVLAVIAVVAVLIAELAKH